MKTQSAKAKGRKLQQLVRDDLRATGQHYGLVAADCESRGMGQNGVDIILSPAAQKVFNLAIECKNVESLNVPKVFEEHYSKYQDSSALKLLVHSKNRSRRLVTIAWADFFILITKLLSHEGKL